MSEYYDDDRAARGLLGPFGLRTDEDRDREGEFLEDREQDESGRIGDDDEDREGSGADLDDPWVIPEPPDDPKPPEDDPDIIFDGPEDKPIPAPKPPPPPLALLDQAVAAAARALRGIRTAERRLRSFADGGGSARERRLVRAAIERCVPGLDPSDADALVAVLSDMGDEFMRTRIVTIESVADIEAFVGPDRLGDMLRAFLTDLLTSGDAFAHASRSPSAILVFPGFASLSAAEQAAVLAHEAAHLADSPRLPDGGIRGTSPGTEDDSTDVLDSPYTYECLVIDLGGLDVGDVYRDRLDDRLGRIRG